MKLIQTFTREAKYDDDNPEEIIEYGERFFVEERYDGEVLITIENDSFDDDAKEVTNYTSFSLNDDEAKTLRDLLNNKYPA